MTSLVALLGMATPGRSQEVTPEFLDVSFLGPTFVLTVRPRTSDWVAVEVSSDLTQWSELVHLATRRAFTVYVDVEAGTVPRRFYRLRWPGLTVNDAEARWLSRPRATYRMRLERISSVSPFLVRGTVTVQEEAKSITEAEADGLMLADPDPAYFPAIEELFAELRRAKDDGVPQLWVTYDPVLGFPLRCTLDYRNAAFTLPDTGSLWTEGLVQYRVLSMSAGD